MNSKDLNLNKFNRIHPVKSLAPSRNSEVNSELFDRVHFIGIGGIMMSAVAKYFLALGKNVTGSDRDQTDIADELARLGAKISFSHESSNIKPNTDLVVFTVAISPNNPELVRAKKLKIPVLAVYQLLGLLSRDKFTIAVAGMHGKSTTTSILGLILEQAKLDPTVFVGTKIKEWNSNFRFGRSKYLLSEACEYKDNFLQYHPDILVINNIEAEHLDYFKNLTRIKQSFAKLISQIKPNGYLVVNADNKYAIGLAQKNKRQNIKIVTFGIKNKADIKPNDYQKIISNLQIPGQFNIYNTLAAIAVSNILNIKPAVVQKTLKNFTGVWRRFEYKGRKRGVDFYDDYAHHPTEIKSTLRAAKEKFKDRNWWLVFQPHLYSRTKDFLPEFAHALSSAPNLIVTHIYPAREKNIFKISGNDIVDLVNKKYKPKNTATYINGFDRTAEYLKQHTSSGDIILTMGAGDVFKVFDLF